MKVLLFRLAAMVTLLTCCVACTRTVREDPDRLIREGNVPDHMSILLTNGEIVESRKATVADSSIVVDFVFQDGMQRRVRPPLVIPRSEIAVITRDEFDNNKLLGFIAVGLVLGMMGVIYQ